ncbi:PREDICTED: dolichol kinase isoform X2 [Papilio polytes]|uniref:dolichol kinase isoform X2 n=1 Tax=Papilio polytes TaxID=76194 RepID=UPI0006767CD8|nr:PREDICTED: dolichol kinase isoform X2 [Papilio polytes]
MEEIRKLSNGYYCKLCEHYVKSLDKNITNNLRAVGIATRPSNSNGLWCYILLPLILLNYTIWYNTSVLYQTVAFLSVGLFFQCSLFILFLSLSGSILMEGDYGGCVACSLISTMLIYAFTNQDLMVSLVITLLCVSSFSSLLKLVLINFPKTFTVGEAMVVVQSIPLFVSAASIQYVQSLLNGVNEEYAFINTLVFTILLTTVFIITSIFVLQPEYRCASTVLSIVIASAIVLLIKWHIILGPNCLFDIIEYVFMDYVRLKLFLFWLLLLLISILVILLQTRTSVKANTVTRKTFHVLASLVFLSGILTDVPLMTLASGVGFSVLIFVEALRIAEIETISSTLQSAFVVYCDDKDSGSFAMTPLYLFVGLACPIILTPEPASLDLLSGVLAVGVGDTAASCAGATFGKNRWSDSNRTLEGTSFNILSQVAVVYFLQFFNVTFFRYFRCSKCTYTHFNRVDCFSIS